jgi:ubiquinone/menaquinone biosynthesis C-methylase UbiE
MTLGPAPLPNPPPAFLIRGVLALKRFVHRIEDAITPPQLAVFEMTIGVAVTQILGAVARHRIPDVLAENGPLTSDELAARLRTHADFTHRMMRVLASRDVFRLRSDGRWENTRLSNALRSEMPSRSREWVEYFASESNCRSWLDFERSLRDGHNAFERVHGTSVWDWFDAHPDERETFAQAMMGITIMDAPAIATLYPFAEVQRLCDVGGGRGTLLSEILVRHPHLRGVLCDAPGVLESARVLCAERGVMDRVEFVPGSFFDSVPDGADAYSMKNILHDWDDDRCVKILKTVRRAMKPGTRLVVAESLVERDDDSPGALADIHMGMVCSDGRERGREEFRTLFERSGFRMARVFPWPTTSVIEGIAV